MDTVPTPDPVIPPTVHRNASWGALISIVIILAMIVVGAFYAWGKRLKEEHRAEAHIITATTTVNVSY